MFNPDRKPNELSSIESFKNAFDFKQAFNC